MRCVIGAMRPWIGVVFLGWLTLVGSGGGEEEGTGPGNGNGGGGGGTPSYRVSVRVDSPIAGGESFQFMLGTQSVTATQSGIAVAFGNALAQGSSYAVSQSGGPRSCSFSANRTGTIGNADVLVTAQCGSAVGTSSLNGELRGPVGAITGVRNNGGDAQALTVPAAAGTAYHVLPFTFATPLPDGAAYGVTLFEPSTEAGRYACRAYGLATGTMPLAPGLLKVGCELKYDLVSRNSDGSVTASDSNSDEPVIGGAAVAIGTTPTGHGEGRYVAFVSSLAALGSTGGTPQVYWRDRQTGETRLISTDAGGQIGNDTSTAPAISADGRTVVFQSRASNLVPGDTNGVEDIFVWQVAADGTRPVGVQRLSTTPGGEQGNSQSLTPVVSGDGRIVAFATRASNLVAGVGGTSAFNVVRLDRGSGGFTLVSRGSVGSGNGVAVGGQQPVISENGNRIAFWSVSNQLTAGDTNGLWDIFVYQHDNGTLRRVTLTAGGGERNAGTESGGRVVRPAISGNGRFVAYATTSTNVVADDTNGLQDVFVVDLDAAGAGVAVQRVSVAGSTQGNGDSPRGQGEAAALDYEGNWVAFTTTATNLGVQANNVLMVNRLTGQVRAVSDAANSSVGAPMLSRSAAYVVMRSRLTLDARFANTGLFAHFTDLARAWWWVD